MKILHQFALSSARLFGGAIVPQEQLVNEFTNSIQAFRELGVTLAILFVVGLGVIGFIIYVIFNYRLRSMLTKRENEDATARREEQKQRDAREQQILMLFSNNVAQIQKMDERDAANSERNTKAVDALTSLVNALDKRQVFYQETLARVDKGVETMSTVGSPGLQAIAKDLTEHRDFAATATAQVLKGLDEVRESIERLKVSIDVFFPAKAEMDERITHIMETLDEVKEKCVDEVKRVSDEIAIVPAPDKADPPDDELPKAAGQ